MSVETPIKIKKRKLINHPQVRIFTKYAVENAKINKVPLI